MISDNKASLLLIYTGGTIGMKQDPKTQTLKPFNFSQILAEVPELGKFAYKIDSWSFDHVIDSSDVDPSLWKELIRIIRNNYDDYDGFVILHGTDTMAYSASALSFMIEGLTKPVIFTGSQLPIGMPRTDGKENLISAVEIAAAKRPDGSPQVPEVCISFGNMLYRGNRTRKVSSDEFKAFRSPNLPPLAEAGISIKYNDNLIMRPADPSSAPVFHPKIDTRVSILKLHPGITRQVVCNILCGDDTRAVIIESYGSGNAPSAPWFLSLVKEAAAMGKVLVSVTQCIAGTVNMSIYSNGKALMDCGVTSGADITPEAALGKLFHLLGEYDDNSRVAEKFSTDLRGEMSC